MMELWWILVSIVCLWTVQAEHEQTGPRAPKQDISISHTAMTYRLDAPNMQKQHLSPVRSYKALKRRKRQEHEAKFCGIDSPTSRRRERDAQPIDTISHSAGPTSRRLITDKAMTVEMAVFIDYELWKQYLDNYTSEYEAETKLKNFVATAFANIQYLYNHPTMTYKITFKIVHYEVFKSQPERLLGHHHQNGDAQEYLDAFCMYQYKLRARSWDQSFLFSGYDLHRQSGTDKTVSGLARLEGACDPFNSCVLVEGHDFTGSFVAAHEIGHGFGLRHDEPKCGGSYLMSGLLGPGKTSWSSCSMDDMAKFIDKLDDAGKNCLRRSGVRAEVLPLDLWHLPGQRYDGDEQCVLMYGNEYREYVPKEDFVDGPCSMMWCGKANYSRVITAHPALEGTYCGDYKYCLHGRCTTWTGGLEAETPRLVNGGWSDWSKFTCSPCTCAPFTGGLAIVPATRSCTNPKPINGGADCTGPSVRGLVCQSQCPPTGDTVKLYIKRKCAAKRDAVGDALTGDGAQLLRDPEKACKVFCALRSQTAWYRFYGDLLPDGTPCGINKYCVAGLCMKLQCENSTLVDDIYACPPADRRCNTARLTEPTRIFPTAMVISTMSIQDASNQSQWNAWSPCSVTCGKGTSTRRRLCTLDGKCQAGGFVQTRLCDRPPCGLPKASWSAWGPWTTCSTTCNDGMQARHRHCTSKSACNGQANEIRVCKPKKPCPVQHRDVDLMSFKLTTWGIWSNWGPCSVSCGWGMETRTRICLTGCRPSDKNNRVTRPCRRPSCAEWGGWGLWSECAGGLKTQTRLRSCYGYGKCNGWTIPKMSREERKCCAGKNCR